jgi:hypothetical protein
MARVEIPVFEVTRIGVSLGAAVTSDPVNGHFFHNPDGKTALVVQNLDTVNPWDLVVDIPGEVDIGIPNPPRRTTIPPGAFFLLGGYPIEKFNRPDGTELVWVDVPNSPGQLRLMGYRLAAE